MKTSSLENKSSPIWPILFLVFVALTFSWDANLAEERRNYAEVLERCQKLIAKQRYPQALTLAMKLHEKFPDHPYYLQLLAEIHGGIGDLSRQVEILERLIESSPAIVAQEICPSRVPAGQIHLLRKCVEHLPDDPDSLLHLGRVEFANGDRQSARSHLEHARTLAPKYADIYVALGKIEEKEGRRDQAYRRFKEASALRPEDPEILTILKSYEGAAP